MKQAIWIIDQFIKQGINNFFIAPGSRSAQITLAVAGCEKANSHIHFDERGLGFYALGFSKASQEPSVIITTSGSAVANLYPTIMEAYHANIPLIIITADRPTDLLYCGANQTTNQTHIFQNCIRGQRQLSVELSEKATRSIIAETCFLAMQNPKGPIHLNCPFQEPYPILPFESSSFDTIEMSFPNFTCAKMETEAKNGIILIGEMKEDPSPIIEMARKLSWPIFADILSQARMHPSDEQIQYFDHILNFDISQKPDLVLKFGGKFLSKNIGKITENTKVILINKNPDLEDGDRIISHRVQSDCASFCSNFFTPKAEALWLKYWKNLDLGIQKAFAKAFEEGFTDSHLLRNLPDQRPIFLGNSTVIRFADRFFFPLKSPQIFANRGVSGIDGNIATIAGIYENLKKPIIGVIGDQTALYDLNSFSLLTNKDILLIIINNFSGAIFDYLPMARTPYLERFFNAKHFWHFEHIAKMFDLPYEKRDGNLTNLPVSGIIEICFDKKNTFDFMQKIKSVSINC